MKDSTINQDYLCFQDFENQAEKVLKENNFQHIYSGANQEYTLRRNVSKFNEIFLNPRILKNVENIDISTTVLGQKISMPLGISPSAFHKLAHPEGEKNLARAAVAEKIICNLSTFSSVNIEEIKQESQDINGFFWYQLYLFKDQRINERIVQLAEQYKYKALVVTIDRPQLGKRERDQKLKIKEAFPVRAEFLEAQVKHFQFSKQDESKLPVKRFEDQLDTTITWKDLQILQSKTKLPIIAKGIQRYQDAKIAASLGIHVWVSNHGARQLDQQRGTIEVLEECVQAVREVGNKSIEVYVDGGVRKGSDILKCLALGANCVFIGRGIYWSNACEGQRGIQKLFKLFKDELIDSMKLTGCNNIQDINKKCLIKQTIPIPNL